MAADPAIPGDRFQFRIGDLALWVVGSAFVLDVARRSRAAWGGGPPDAEHVLGLVVLAMSTTLALVLARQGFRAFRDRAGPHSAWSLGWRTLAVGWLAWSVAEGSLALQVDATTLKAPGFEGARAGLRLRMVPLVSAIGLVGLVLSSRPPRPGRSAAGPGRRSWPMVLVVGLGGLGIVAAGHGMIPYLVLLAIEAVQHALIRGPMVPRVSVFDRLTRAGLEALPGVIACLATAAWVDDDLRKAARDPAAARVPRSWPGVIFRAATALAALADAAYIVLVSTPRLSPSLAEGVASMVDPPMAATIVLGFAGLAAGISARSAACLAIGPGGGTPIASAAPRLGPWPRRILAGFAGLLALTVTAASIQAITRDLEYRWYVPISLHGWLQIARTPVDWLGYPFAGGPLTPMGDLPSVYLLIGTLAWLAIRLLGLAASGGGGRPSALDAIAGDRPAIGRFLGGWAGLTIVMVASLPILAVCGVALTHLGIARLSR